MRLPIRPRVALLSHPTPLTYRIDLAPALEFSIGYECDVEERSYLP